jgi:hypothetical protein
MFMTAPNARMENEYEDLDRDAFSAAARGLLSQVAPASRLSG